ncbi:type I-F CRISPR-associated protein Csy1 [Acetobacter persici]|uniref:Type I-F CRISPR-associated protein Csy1 n=1 Tax=Acetobacter persici TaxID=1076596 RepID=A0A1U9LK64_9PROT|nr:type I-F CRISPR-associated protein Csy1 [Acetobacter persici]AQT06680.1 hypothetical protein A0U91_16895 [Acetobacter persici]
MYDIRRTVAFDEAIRKFATDRLRKKMVISEDAFASHKKISELLNDMASRGKKVFPATHIAKGGHPSSQSRNIWINPRGTPGHPYAGTLSLLGSRDYTLDIAATATTQDVAAFVSVLVDRKSIAEWMLDRDESLESALSTYIDHPMRFMGAVAEQDERAPSHVDKQIYWLAGTSAEKDADFVILQPVFASCVAHYVHQAVRTVNSKANGEARNAWRQGLACDRPFVTMPGLAMRQIGGSKPHNVSFLNARRFGENFLLPSIPPAWSAVARPVSLSHRESGVSLFLTLIRSDLVEVEEAMETATCAKRINKAESDLIGRFIAFSDDVRGAHSIEWFKSDECELIEAEQCWFRPPPEGRSGLVKWKSAVLTVAQNLADELSFMMMRDDAAPVKFSPSEFASKAARRMMLSALGPAGIGECAL